MATVAENLQTILDIKNDIKTAIEGKGVAVGDVSFTEYSSKIESIETGGGSGGCDVNTRVLDITKNGTYATDYTQPDDLNLQVCGYFPDGTPFYNYAILNGAYFNTGIKATADSRIEFWWKNDDKSTQYRTIVGAQDFGEFIFKIAEDVNSSTLRTEYGSQSSDFENTFSYKSGVWHNIVFSKADGLVLDGVKQYDLNGTFNTTATPNFYINMAYDLERDYNANGYFGMVKIDDNIFIPTPNGFINYETNELLETNLGTDNSTYTFIEGSSFANMVSDLIRTVTVNVQPKINLAETGLKFAYSKFTEVPDWIDWDGIEDMSNMFDNCKNLTYIPMIDTSNVNNIRYMFQGCESLETIPLLDFGKITDLYYCFKNCRSLETIPLFNTSNVTTFYNCFDGCNNLKTIPQINTSSATDVGTMFRNCSSLQSLPLLDFSNVNYRISSVFGTSNITTLTDVGGFKNLKIKWNDGSGLNRLPNLTYQSCKNILENLYDFTGNGETPTSSQAQLKVHQNFLDLIGDEISIGTNKGWTISK